MPVNTAAGQIEGIDPALFSSVMSYKGRLVFIERESTSAWYLDTGVVGGLATAFETTLVALLAAVVIQLISTWVYKREEALLDSINEFTTEHILSRLKLTDWQ